jgi:hypothetical protein
VSFLEASGGNPHRLRNAEGVRALVVQQLGPPRCALLLDGAVAANLVGHAGELHCRCVLGGAELREDFVGLLDLFLDHLALVAALLGLAKDVERAATQALHPREQPEGAEHPGTLLALLQLAGDAVALGQQRRREVVGDPGGRS